MSKFQMLPKRTSPKWEESLESYLIRLSKANAFESVREFIKTIGLTEVLGTTKINEFQNRAYRISLLTGKVEATIVKMTFIILQEQIKHNIVYMIRTPISVYNLRTRKICPLCIAQAPYYQRLWDLVFVTACPIHHCLLVDHCPACRMPIKTFKNEITMCECGFNLTKCSFRTDENLDIMITKIFAKKYGYNVVLVKRKNEKKYSYVDKLTSYHLSVLLSVLLLFRNPNRKYSNAMNKTRMNLFNNNQVHTMIIWVTELLSDWPIHFYDFLETLKSNKPFWFGKMYFSRSTEIGAFISEIYGELKNPCFDFLRLALEEFLKGKLKEVNKTRLNNSMRTKFINVIDASTKTGLNISTFLELLVGGKLCGKIIDFIVYIEKRSLNEYIRKNNEYQLIKKIGLLD